MPSHDAKHEPQERHLSRRSVLQGAATAGAAGLAFTAVGAAASSALAATSPSSPRSGGDVKAPSGPIVVHVHDARSGELDVFSGTSQTRLRDKDLAARIARAVR
jgi:nitrous oxide reductase